MNDRLHKWLAAEWHMLKTYGLELVVAGFLIGALIAMARAPKQSDDPADERPVSEAAAATNPYNP